MKNKQSEATRAARQLADEAIAAAVKLAATAAETAAKLASTATETAKNLEVHKAECLMYRQTNSNEHNALRDDFKSVKDTQKWMLFTTIGTLLTAVGGLFVLIMEKGH